MRNSSTSGRLSSACETFFVFLRLGLTSFGGPTAHLGYFRTEFVERRRWVSDGEYTELIAYSQFLPGPGSSQVGFALGKIRGGYLGAMLAWLGFTLPSAVIMIALALGAPLLTGGVWQGVLAGLTAVAVAVVAHAVWSMARTLTPDLRRMLIACVAAVLALVAPGVFGQLGAIAFGAGAGLLFCRDSPAQARPAGSRPLFDVSRRVAVSSLVALGALLLALPILASALRAPVLEMADAFVRAGTLVFGGGHVLLPLLAAEPAVLANIDSEQLLAGYSAAQALPGPLFTFAAYLGAATAPGWNGIFVGVVGLIAVFLPGMLLLLGFAPFWNAVRERRAARRALAGVNAAVVGILAAALIHPVFTSGITSVALLGVAVTALVLLWVKTPPWLVVALGALAGITIAAIGAL